MQSCNDQPCYDWPNKGWTDWATWGQCSKSCNGGTRERRRFCKNLDNSCGDDLDYEVVSCNETSCPVNSCAKELKINLDQSKFHTENFFRYDGLYHRTEDNSVDQDRYHILFEGQWKSVGPSRLDHCLASSWIEDPWIRKDWRTLIQGAPRVNCG